jgi:hypothetical protein
LRSRYVVVYILCALGTKALRTWPFKFCDSTRYQWDCFVIPAGLEITSMYRLPFIELKGLSQNANSQLEQNGEDDFKTVGNISENRPCR